MKALAGRRVMCEFLADRSSTAQPSGHAAPAYAGASGTPETLGLSEAAYVESAEAYAEADLLSALRAAGLMRGDLVFVQVCLDTLGPVRGVAGASPARGAMVLRVLREAVGETGTLLLPAYTFSFCRREVFDVERSAPIGGDWSTSADVLEYARQMPGAVRSGDPIHSAVAIGPDASSLMKDLPPTCFGEDCLQHRLRRAGGKICTIGTGPDEATMVLHAEVMSGVPFRYKKLFTGDISEDGTTRREGWIYDVRVRCPNTALNPDRMLRESLRAGVVRRVAIGQDALHVMDAQPFYEFLREQIAADPWFTVKGPPVADLAALDARRVARIARAHSIHNTARRAPGGHDAPAAAAPVLPRDASMEEIVRGLWMVRRDIVSDGYDAALAALATQVPLRIHEYPTGRECFNWFVPEKWTCHGAWLETLDGRRLFSYDDHPLHVVSYSLPFEGVVTRDELLPHLHVHDRLPDAIPFMFKYYDRDWGLCCSRRLRDSLRDEQYRVHIRTSFSYGTLKVGEVIVPGTSDETIVLAAHLCHPGMAMDDLSGVAVAIDVMRALLRRPPGRYTYRLLILPETIGSLAYLSDHQDLIPRMKGGLFLEMLGLDNPHALQRSFAAETGVDACFVAALQRHDPSGWTAPYRALLGNDERQFNAPGVRVPMLSLMRVLPKTAADYPYREYHSSLDTPAIVSAARLEDSRDLVLRMMETLEQDRVPTNRFAGEVCCSRYGLHIDWFKEPEAHWLMFTIMDLLDGTRSIRQIAAATGQTIEAVEHVLDRLEARGLITYDREGVS
jgi:aminopeptidase-like protein/aminoglycoside N3'-acetyltransferase